MPDPLEIALGYEPDEQAFVDSLKVNRRQVTDEQIKRFEGYAAEIFSAFGMEMDTLATVDTPRRFIRALYDVTNGYDGDPKLLTVFATECRGEPDCHTSQVIEGPIHFAGLCEHHALPILGQAYVGYIAHETIIGISKLTRLVRLYASRFTVQERIGPQITTVLDAMLRPHGVAVYLEGDHLCTRMRGVREISSVTRTSYWRGRYAEDPTLRAEFFASVKAKCLSG